MPITEFQKQVLLILKKSRNPESYVAGGTVIQRKPDSLRFSRDIDFFHDTDEAVVTAYENDRKTLIAGGYQFDTLISQPAFYRAVISKEGESLKLEWVRDTAFRFFPVLEDPDFGYRLHDLDLAINKCLALGNRTAVRDLIDMLAIDKEILSLAGCVWAACGKDPGFTPPLLIELMERHALITPDLLSAESLVRPLDPKTLKSDCLKMFERAKSEITTLESQDLGCLFLDKKGNAIKNFSKGKKSQWTRHFGSVRGSWPRMIE